MAVSTFSAILVENENGTKTLLSETDANQRQAIAKRLLTPSVNSQSALQSCKKVCLSVSLPHLCF